MTEDIKDLLGRAIDAEPPLRLDRDEVLKAGRKRLRRRRLLEGGGVVAAVVVAVVGASLLSGVVGSAPDEKLPPAATSTSKSPIPGIDLPLPQTTRERPAAPPQTRQHAAQLTEKLFDTSTIKGLGALEATPTGGGGLAFQLRSDAYVFEADTAIGRPDGALQVSVEPAAPDEVADCAAVPPPFDGCAMHTVNDIPVAVATWKNPDGDKQYLAFTVSDGSKVAALSTNVSTRQKMKGMNGVGEPILGISELTKLVVYAGLRAY